MKKKAFLIVLLICFICCLLISCGNKKDDTSDSASGGWKVTFVNGSDRSNVIYVNDGDRVTMPSDPVKNNYVFIGWFSDYSCTRRYDFSKSVHSDLTLYAKFELDASKITNEISQNTMKSIVKIECQYYKEMLWGLIKYDKSGWYSGSGFCFSENDGYYYILTNCHVIKGPTGYDKMEIKVTDYKDNEYTAYLYNNPNTKKDAISPEYDLACIYFKSNDTEVQPLKVLSTDPKVGDDVIAIGYPGRQNNTIAFGKVAQYCKVTLSDTPKYESNVTFDVIQHSAYTKGGSSGGPILNSNLQVIGVHYAGSTTYEDIHYAIPANKVTEFLNEYVYK